MGIAKAIFALVVTTQLVAAYAAGGPASTDPCSQSRSSPEHSSLVGKASEGRIINFDQNGFRIAKNSMPVISAHSEYLLANASVCVQLSGSTDEVGTREYNLALGLKRAESVNAALLQIGVPAEQIYTASQGSERPLADGHSRSARAKNRRVDIEYR